MFDLQQQLSPGHKGNRAERVGPESLSHVHVKNSRRTMKMTLPWIPDPEPRPPNPFHYQSSAIQRYTRTNSMETKITNTLRSQVRPEGRKGVSTWRLSLSLLICICICIFTCICISGSLATVCVSQLLAISVYISHLGFFYSASLSHVRYCFWHLSPSEWQVVEKFNLSDRRSSLWAIL